MEVKTVYDMVNLIREKSNEDHPDLYKILRFLPDGSDRYLFCKKLDEFCRAVFRQEKVDSLHDQKIYAPSKVIRERVCDPKGLALLYAAVFNRMKIPFLFKLTDYRKCRFSYLYLSVYTGDSFVTMHTDLTVNFNESIGFPLDPKFSNRLQPPKWLHLLQRTSFVL